MISASSSVLFLVCLLFNMMTMVAGRRIRCLNGVERMYDTCECLAGWTGAYCENPLPSICDSHPCGSGECLPVQHRSLTHVCLCANGDLARTCPTEFNPCQSNPCLHGGICSNLTSSYICICPDGQLRKECYAEDPLQSSCSCRNGGICITKGSAGQCACPPGYTGSFCETEYFQCLSNGRFTDRYHCHEGKYFECVHGQRVTRICPLNLRFNVLVDRCDYPPNVSCPDL